MGSLCLFFYILFVWSLFICILFGDGWSGEKWVLYVGGSVLRDAGNWMVEVVGLLIEVENIYYWGGVFGVEFFRFTIG